MNNVDISVYKESGQITKCIICQKDDATLYLDEGESYIIARSDLCTQYIDKGLVIDMPPRPDENYVFDYTSKAWIPNLPSANERAISKRNQLLADGPDRVNPMWWASMSTAEQAAVTEYRQALLDITNQPGYPMDIEWPEIPSVFKG